MQLTAELSVWQLTLVHMIVGYIRILLMMIAAILTHLVII